MLIRQGPEREKGHIGKGPETRESMEILKELGKF